MISDLRYGVTGRTPNSGKWIKPIKTNYATSMRARHGVLLVEPGHDDGIRPDVAKSSQRPAPLWSQDSGRRLLPGQSRARQSSLPLSWWQIDRPKDNRWPRPNSGGAAPTLAGISTADSGEARIGRSRKLGNGRNNVTLTRVKAVTALREPN
jgi:hypothetical protein